MRLINISHRLLELNKTDVDGADASFQSML